MILSIKSMIVLYSTYKAAYIIKDIVGTFKYVYRTFRSSSKYHVIGEDDEYEIGAIESLTRKCIHEGEPRTYPPTRCY